jgi:hypothetical protein
VCFFISLRSKEDLLTDLRSGLQKQKMKKQYYFAVGKINCNFVSDYAEEVNTSGSFELTQKEDENDASFFLAVADKLKKLLRAKFTTNNPRAAINKFELINVSRLSN